MPEHSKLNTDLDLMKTNASNNERITVFDRIEFLNSTCNSFNMCAVLLKFTFGYLIEDYLFWRKIHLFHEKYLVRVINGAFFQYS